MDDGWTYVAAEVHDNSSLESSFDYPYRTRFGLLLADRLSGPQGNGGLIGRIQVRPRLIVGLNVRMRRVELLECRS